MPQCRTLDPSLTYTTVFSEQYFKLSCKTHMMKEYLITIGTKPDFNYMLDSRIGTLTIYLRNFCLKNEPRHFLQRCQNFLRVAAQIVKFDAHNHAQCLLDDIFFYLLDNVHLGEFQSAAIGK